MMKLIVLSLAVVVASAAVMPRHDFKTCGRPAIKPSEELVMFNQPDAEASDLNSRIVGGQQAKENSWPWQVQVRKFGSHYCGGSLVAERFIVSAAHCFGVGSPSANNYEFRLGSHRKSATDATELVIKSGDVKKIHVHEKYFGLTTGGYDIALIELKEDVKYTDAISPICVPHDDVEDGKMCYTTGWGNTQGTGSSSYLNQVDVPVVKQSTCNDWYTGRIKDDMICLGYEGGKKDSCQGDSGGPVACKISDMDDEYWELHGITSWGSGCAQAKKPGVYTRVTTYHTWIEDHYARAEQEKVVVQKKKASARHEMASCGMPAIAPSEELVVFNSIINARRHMQPASIREERIVGGQQAKENSWPWQVQVRKFGSHYCGGSLVHNRFIVSAAHCFGVGNPSSNNYEFRLGSHRKSVTDDTELVIKSGDVKKIHVHEKYFGLTTGGYDIALIELKEEVKYTDEISPICLPHKDVAVGKMCFTTGWGNTQSTGSSNYLNQVDVPVVSNTQCNEWYSGSVKDDMICLGYEDGGKDSCQGDSGGPVACKVEAGDDMVWELHGVTSWGSGCARPKKPGVYTRVTTYHDWILEKVDDE